ncbi:hypothetical protein PsorP6_010850 [Peronosclerospora sorghi]|uniref:Uncharacterized protein n=1 Tax=Peronosclerospora sorghi TaxID=230839 RepID=A0ACC0VW68_9STRA|nr:hypothetical protein PsorP6_010850 [Peronosclerospora sorghi]
MITDEMARLRAVLRTCDKETQGFLQPLLSLRGVQELLLTFVRDTSRTFEDWVWDPQVRQTLVRMRNAEAQHEGRAMDQWYAHAMHDHVAAMALQHPDAETPVALLEEAEAAQNDGRVKFQAKNYYAAKNEFLKSLEAVLKYQTSEYYGTSRPPDQWDDVDMQARYVTLCTNLAICGLKLKNLSLINEYATKALTVEERSTKALYAMTKLRLLEHRYDEAIQVVEKALTFYPDKTQFLNLRKEVEATRRKEAMKEAELAEMSAKHVQRAMDAAAKSAKARMVAQNDRAERVRQEIEKRVETTPLPAREDDNFAAARLNGYFNKIRQRMVADIRSIYNPEAGEDPLFECSIRNESTGNVLAANVQGNSKKIVKNKACMIAIEKLWSDKEATGKLTPEDLAYLESYERAKASEEPAVSEPVKTPMAPQQPIRVSCLERQLQPLPLLNQLTHRGHLQARFDIEDVSPNKEVTEFKCMGYLNGEHVATANAISKKKARVEVARQVLALAFEKKILMVYDGPGTTADKTKDLEGTDDVSPPGE